VFSESKVGEDPDKRNYIVSNARIEASGWKPGKVVPFVNTQVREEMPSFSPDGRWIAYESFKSGGTEVYVRPFQHPGGEVLVSIRGGARPRVELSAARDERECAT